MPRAFSSELDNGPSEDGAFMWLPKLGISAAIFAAALLLLMPALWNGFPFILDDTMSYVYGDPVIFRSVFYNMFVRTMDLGLSMWLPIFVQSLIVVHLLWIWTRILVLGAGIGAFLLAVIVLGAGSSLGVVAGYLMPDIFTSVMILGLGLLALHHRKLTRGELAYVFAVTLVAASVHLSHVSIAIGVALANGAALVLQRQGVRSVLNAMALSIAPIVLAALAVFTSNVVLYGIPKISPVGSVFMVASLIGKGPARDYLAEACPAAGYRICPFVNELPDDSNKFLWGGTLHRLGWFEGYREEAAEIVSQTIKTRPLAVAHSVVKSFGQALLAHAPGWDFRQLGWNTHTFEASIEARYGDGAVESWRRSLQATESLPRQLWKQVDSVLLPVSLSLFVFGSAVAWRNRWIDLLTFNVIVAAGIAANTFVCAAGSGVFDRYQTRVTWLIPFAAIVFLLRVAESRRSSSEAALPTLTPFSPLELEAS